MKSLTKKEYKTSVGISGIPLRLITDIQAEKISPMMARAMASLIDEAITYRENGGQAVSSAYEDKNDARVSTRITVPLSILTRALSLDCGECISKKMVCLLKEAMTLRKNKQAKECNEGN